ncbi:pheromone shutdown-related protein TraB [Nitzschia inconspicua]|uniref:Pheromone shutdown-related protein TraB n=1 Tax=Nitzschia inconspicua TaxID=303405 RepID=A0A9K3K7D8_9STRA|nr:pheromone shutdown-related protein TraB [Nitzschia inconspicua]KAG7348273.1 pheromone shutdown-related protein TraB [Nitzschia inconspicua]
MGPLSSSTSSSSDDTVVELSTPRNQKIILVGTGHMSRKSQEEVQAVIQQVQPNMVLVELDASRLPRIGIDGIQGIQVDLVVTAAEDILATSDEEDPGFNLVARWQKTFLDGFSKIARTWLTSMYDGMRDRQKLVQSKLDANEVIPGGEMLVAIRAAEQCPACDTVVLGDRSSVKTIQRAAQLAWDSGDALGVLRRLQSENQAAVKELRARVCVDLGLDDSNGISKEDEALLEMEVMEALRNDSQVRDRLFQRLEERVPEFTQAFLKERDLIMGESIRRELEREGVERVVAVVGLAHVPGIRNILESSFASLPTTKSQ